MASLHAPGIDIRRSTSGTIPDVPFVRIKNHVLGPDYQLSLLFADPKTAEELHLQWKGKPGPANILSFPLDETSGEIIMSLQALRAQYRQFNHDYLTHVAYMFIHGLLHLKGFDHGSTMEVEEERIMREFKLR